MTDFPRCRRTSWAELDAWADRLSESILRADRVPQTLIALTRGGWVPARLLADRLGLHRILAVRARHWGVTATRNGKAELADGVHESVREETVLVVDDITDTGQSLKLAVDHVRALGPSRVESATLLHIAHSEFVPDYFAEEIPRESWVWIVFPWNFWEDLRVLGGRALEAAGGDERGARAILAERCALDVSLEELHRALDAGRSLGRALEAPQRTPR